MRQQEVFNKIGGIIRELNEQYTYMQSAEDLFNDLELELMAANAHFLSDHVEILRKISRTSEKPQPVVNMPLIVENKPVPEIIFEPEKEALAVQYFEETTSASSEVAHPGGDLEGGNFDTKNNNSNEVSIIYELKPDIIRHELIIEDTGEDWDEEDNYGESDLQPGSVEDIIKLPETKELELEVTVPQPEPVIIKPETVKPQPGAMIPEPIPAPAPKPEIHQQIMVEEQQVMTLNERMSAQLASRKADQFVPQPVTDLKSAITLNDKLLYVKDLFHGYSLAYAEALDILNRMHTIEEAESFLKTNYAVKNNWADKQATADKFYALLRRRYIVS